MTPKEMLESLPMKFDKIAEIKIDKPLFSIDVMPSGAWRVAYSTGFKAALERGEVMTTKYTGEADMPEKIYYDHAAYLRADLVAAKDAEIARLRVKLMEAHEDAHKATNAYALAAYEQLKEK